jgi:hypothetical protein
MTRQLVELILEELRERGELCPQCAQRLTSRKKNDDTEVVI